MRSHSTRHNAVQMVEAALMRNGLSRHPHVDYVIVSMPGGRLHPVVFVRTYIDLPAKDRVRKIERIEAEGITVIMGNLPAQLSNAKETT